MQLTNINIGTKLEISVDHDFKEHKQKYISQLEQIMDDNTLIIAAPIFEGKIIAISPGARLNLVFYHEKGIFFFQAEVQKKGIKENINVLKILANTPLKRIQRREYFRFNWVMPVKYKVISDEQNFTNHENIENFYDENENEPFKEALTKNISGGGIGIITHTQYVLKQHVIVQLILDKKTKVNVLGEIVRVKLYDPVTLQYDTGILFTHISHQKRSMIIKFIFNQQIKLKQKGMV